MTTYKSQGKTMKNAIVNLVDCYGTEAPYVMVSRLETLDGLVLMTPFPKAKICCRSSQDLRLETVRLEKLALQTIV
ncbi:hypothetical protein C8R43DRAFT_831784, partial [Mycena crocata]